MLYMQKYTNTIRDISHSSMLKHASAYLLQYLTVFKKIEVYITEYYMKGIRRLHKTWKTDVIYLKYILSLIFTNAEQTDFLI